MRCLNSGWNSGFSRKRQFWRITPIRQPGPHSSTIWVKWHRTWCMEVLFRVQDKPTCPECGDSWWQPDEKDPVRSLSWFLSRICMLNRSSSDGYLLWYLRNCSWYSPDIRDLYTGVRTTITAPRCNSWLSIFIRRHNLGCYPIIGTRHLPDLFFGTVTKHPGYSRVLVESKMSDPEARQEEKRTRPGRCF